jgi:hypothetical protein
MFNIAQNKKWLIVFSAVLFVAIGVKYLQQPRSYNSEEVVIHNASYMTAEYNKATYPVYDSYNPGNWESMYTHPPVHYVMVGWLMKLFEEADALLVYHMIIIAILFFAICFLREDHSLKHQLLLQVYVFGLVCLGIYQNFSFRPEMALSLLWLAGLFFLERSRKNSFETWSQVTGSLMIVGAASIHFFAYPMVLSLLPYSILALVRYGVKDGIKKTLPMALTAVFLGLAYMTVFIIPNLKNVYIYLVMAQKTNTSTFNLHSPLDMLRFHLDAHHNDGFYASEWGIPVGLVAVVILLLFKQSRFLAISAGLYIVSFTFQLKVKKSHYGFPEWLLFQISIAYGLSYLFAAKPFMKKAGDAALTLVALFILLGVFTGFNDTCLNKIHPLNAVRATAQTVVGKHALMGGRHGLWYISGAEKWYNEEDGIFKKIPDTLQQYLKGADYFALHPLLDYESVNMRMEGLYYCGDIKLSACFLGNVPFAIFSAKHVERTDAPPFFIVNSDSLKEILPNRNGNWMYGAVAISTEDKKNELEATMKHRMFPKTLFPTNDSLPLYIGFFASPFDSSFVRNYENRFLHFSRGNLQSKSYCICNWNLDSINRHEEFYHFQHEARLAQLKVLN